MLGVALDDAMSSSSSSLGWAAAEACDVLFSVFDDYYSDVLAEYKLLEKLEQFGRFLEGKVNRKRVSYTK